MLGFFAAVTRVVDHDVMREAVKASVPAGTEELNLKAFEAGLLYFEEHYGAGVPGDAEAGEPVVSPMA
jgi:2-oxoglutarate ferredoxin oxidoreductase subunit gamma